MSELVLMVDPTDLQLKPLTSPLRLLNGETVMGDLTQEQGVQAGRLIPQAICPLSDGFIRRWGTPPWQNMGDGTAMPVFADISLAEIQAANDEAAAQQAAALAAQEAAEQAASLPQRQTVAYLKQAYASATQQFCALAGIDSTNVLTVQQIETAKQSQAAGSAPREELLELAVELEVLRTRLQEISGRQDILDTIPTTGAITIPTA